METSLELTPPPLPPRPAASDRQATSGAGSLRLSKRAPRPQLQSQATTALSFTDIHTQSRLDQTSLHSSPASRAVSRKHSYSNLGRFASSTNSDIDDSASLKSFVPTLDARLDGDSVLGDLAGNESTPGMEGTQCSYRTRRSF